MHYADSFRRPRFTGSCWSGTRGATHSSVFDRRSTGIDEQVRQRIRQSLQAAKLPRTAPVKLWVGPATSVPCSGCGELIDSGYEYELAFGPGVSLRFHPRCYVIWDEERAASESS
jgi:hypothetical protein